MEPRVDRIIRLAEAIASALVRRHCLNDEPDKPHRWKVIHKVVFSSQKDDSLTMNCIGLLSALNMILYAYRLTYHIYIYAYHIYLQYINIQFQACNWIVVWYLASCFVVTSLWHGLSTSSQGFFQGVPWRPHSIHGEMDHHGGSESFAWRYMMIYVVLVWTATNPSPTCHPHMRTLRPL